MPRLFRARPPSPPGRSRRAGFGAPFVVVMSVLVLLSLYAVSMSVRSQGASQQTRKALYQETCEELAELVLAEAVFHVRRHANDGAHPLFAALRERGGGILPALDLAELPHSQAEFTRKSGYSLESMTLEVVRWQEVGTRATVAVDYEALGMLSIAGRVTGPEFSSALRELEIDFRTTLAAAPQPFDRMTFFLGDTEALLRTRARNNDPNQTIQFAADTMATIRRDLESILGEIPGVLAELTRLKQLADSNPLVSSSKKQKLRLGLQAMTQLQLEFRQALTAPQWPANPAWTVTPTPSGTPGPNTLHLFQMPLSVYSFDASIDLEKLHLPKVIGPLLEAFAARDAARATAVQNTQAAQARAQDDPMGVLGPMKQLLDVLAQDVQDLHGVLTGYKLFQDRLVESSGPERDELTAHAERLYTDEFYRKADYLFVGEGQAAKAAEFLKMRPPPIGVVFVDDPSAPLVVDVGDVVGRLVVFSGRAMIVEGAKVRDPQQDALVLIANEEMKVLTPEIQAGLVCLTGDYFGPETSFSGALLLGSLRDQRTLETALKGTVERLDPLASTTSQAANAPPDSRAIVAVLGPVPLYRRSAR